MPEEHTQTDCIRARGVRVHNLKEIDVDIPRGRFVAVTGVSGSGKSSLVLDTLYAEGQRRYVESFSAYARQFLERMDKPDVDSVENIPPAIAIEQKNSVKNRRSTVGTATELADYLRLFFARAGRVFCPDCGARIQSHNTGEVVERVMQQDEGARFMVCFPLRLTEQMELEEQIDRIREMGFVRLLVEGEVYDISMEEPDICPGADAEVVVDRLIVGGKSRQRLAEAVETCYRLGRGQCRVRFLDGPVLRFSQNFCCTRCGRSIPEISARLLSFNSPLGACEACSGYGATIDMDPQRVVPNPRLSLEEGAIQPWTTDSTEECMQQLLEGAPRAGIPVDVPWGELSDRQRRKVFEGTAHFYGVRDWFEWLQEKKYKLHVRVLLSRYRRYITCEECGGTRLCPEARSVRVQDYNIADVSAMTIERAYEFFHEELELTDYQQKVVSTVLEEIRDRLDYLYRIGLGYVTLDRTTRTLSGGEMQRVNLATSLGSALVNTLYILDEPSIGLHPRDNSRLIEIVKRLRDRGNTVAVVEHDRQIIEEADHVIDLGPGAGQRGGRVVYTGGIDGLHQCDESVTGAYLRGEASIPLPETRRPTDGERISLTGCRHHNLKDIDVDIPLGTLTCVTGVSGSGKSSLVQDTLYGAIKRHKPDGYGEEIGEYETIGGQEMVEDAVLVDQSPIGTTPRSNPATYINAFGPIRKLFAGTREAKIRNLDPGTFSFNTSDGRCENCKGTGTIEVEMQFLADVYVTCDECEGRRYQQDVLDIKYRGKSILDVLEMTVAEAMQFFSDQRSITRRLKILYRTGLGYIKLGQPATTLSGGEAQRLKLASYMSAAESDPLLLIFDEPTIGLHFDDIRKLLSCFQELVEDGHTVLVVEHNLDVVKCADHVIDLGPEEGQRGGRVVAAGPPETIAACDSSHTGHYLADVLP
ncbi:MAG: excinuclease ABC subunit UvrA [Candidatus Brocadiia bacterium]